MNENPRRSFPGAHDCLHCETRAQNPLCSVDSALGVIQSARSSSRFKSGQTVFYQGNSPLGLFTVQSGLVKVEVVSPDGEAHTLRLMGPGCVLGYRSLFAGDTYRASAIAVEDSELCFVPKAEIMGLFASHPEVALNMAQRLSRDLRLAEEKWVIQVDREAPSRVAEALLFLTDHFAQQAWTRREIAEWAGTTPETVMRALSQFEKQGWIREVDKIIQILDRAHLNEKAQRV